MSGFNWVDDLPPAIGQAMCEKARLRVLPDGATIYRQGDPVTEVYQIVSGEIRQCILSPDGQEVLIYVYKSGDLVGDSSAVDGEPYSLTLITRGEVTVRTWALRDFAQLRGTFPEVERAVSTQTSRRLRSVLRLVEELLTQSLPARIASRFFWMAEMQKAGGQGADLSLSQAEIGQMVGSARQSVNKVVTELRRLHLIETDYGRVIVKDLQGLRRYIEKHQR